MTISIRSLKKWRQQALRGEPKFNPDTNLADRLELNRRILILTQELMDQHLKGGPDA